MLPDETQSKGIAGAVGAALAALIPVLVSFVTGSGIKVEQFTELSTALVAIATLGVSALLGWATVYFAPRNKPVE